jgi:hypothetical protein
LDFVQRDFNADKINVKNCMLRYDLSDKCSLLAFPQFSQLTVGLLDILKGKTSKGKVVPLHAMDGA